MTGRERLQSIMRGETTDRVPVAPFVHNSTVLAWRENPEADVIEGTLAFCDHFGFDVILRNFPVRADAFREEQAEWQPVCASETRGNRTRNTTVVKTPGGALRLETVSTRLSPYLSVDARTEYPIKTREDFERIRRYAPVATPPLAPLSRAKRLLGQGGITAPWCSGVFNRMSELRALEDLLTDPLDDPDFYGEFAEWVLARQMTEIAPVLDAGVDMISLAGNIASASMVGPAFFERYVLPYEKRLIDFIQARCLGVVYHNCGDGAALIPAYHALGMRCYESMSEPPYGDNDPAAFARGFRPDTVLMGNIDQIEFLKIASPEQVKERACRLLEVMRGRPFILGTSDFLECGTPEENLFALAGAARLR